MNAKDRLYEKKFDRLIAQLPRPPGKKTCSFYNGRLHTFNASVDKTPAARKIHLISRLRVYRDSL